MANAFAYLHTLETADLPMRSGHHDVSLPAIDGLDANGNPNFTQSTDFDYDAIDERNGWTDPKPAAEVAKDNAFVNAADLLGEILRWLAGSDSLSSMGIRGWALVTAIRPDLLPAKNQARIAAALGITRQAISKRVAEVVALTGGRYTHGTLCHGKEYRTTARMKAIRQHIADGTMRRFRAKRT